MADDETAHRTFGESIAWRRIQMKAFTNPMDPADATLHIFNFFLLIFLSFIVSLLFLSLFHDHRATRHPHGELLPTLSPT